jgi:hypothetical protein
MNNLFYLSKNFHRMPESRATQICIQNKIIIEKVWKTICKIHLCLYFRDQKRQIPLQNLKYKLRVMTYAYKLLRRHRSGGLSFEATLGEGVSEIPS